MVSGISITRGSPRQHVWTYVAYQSEGVQCNMMCDSLYCCIMDQLSITNQIHCCTHSELAVEAIQLSDTRHVLVSVHVTGGVVTSAALHECTYSRYVHHLCVPAAP